ncbi:lysis protein [Buttiauxella sp. WJP83]|uniref:lysis protein n=1 Tax=Buttiauxella sp. WJP83 TaxID=2986951 RepID=UPI0022DE833C|nr:lysis protein [Buttiauxella sp. WJP83]WBM69145.1 lysis protein [Buttiauxella sp. WJP83]
MKLSYQLLIAAFVISLAGGLVWSANHYHTKYQDEKHRADKTDQSLTLANQTISDMQIRQRDVAALDAKYIGELADAKATIEQLQRDIAAGTKRLRLAATCQGVSSATSPTSLDDVASPRLTDTAQRDYFALRERIETSSQQIAGMQDYIRQQCMK